MIEWLSAQEIADAAVRLRLTCVPSSKRRVQDYAERRQWAANRSLCRKRQGRGGGIEYHLTLLPDAMQAALQGEQSRSIALANQQVRKAHETSRREALDVANLTARQRGVMDARSLILTTIDVLAIGNGLSEKQAIEAFLAAPEAAGVSLETFGIANDRKCGDRDLSLRTVQRWFGLRKSGVGSLAPLPTKEKQEMPEWFWQFLRFYAQPQKPCLTDALDRYRNALPAHVMPPNYDQVRRLLARLGNVEKHRGREGSLTLKSRMAYIMRSTADLLPTCIYTADGKTFDAEVAHPIHGQPFRPEITSIVDVATRKCVGFSVGLAENQNGVADALRNACETNGIPAIFYVDRGPGFRNDHLDNQLSGLMGRLGITKLHSLPYNSQARGIIERFNGSVWNPLAETYQTYIGEKMDRQAKQRAFKETRRDLKLIGTSKRLPSFEEFVSACREAIAAYNQRPHSSLDGMSPNQMWEYHVSTGFEIVPVLDAERDYLFRPFVKRRTNRAMVEFLTNSYFHLALEEFHGDDVLVGYDIHDASRVWVHTIDRDSGDIGQLICVAVFAGNEQRYIPLTMERAAMEKRAVAREKRLNTRLAEVAAELSPGRFLEASASPAMPIIDLQAEPIGVTALLDNVMPISQSAPIGRIRPAFRTDEELAAWALDNPSSLTSNQVQALRSCLQRPAALELFRMSGIDVDALREIVRAAA